MDPTRATAKWRNVSRSHWIGGRMEVHWSRQARTVPCCPFEATPPSIGQSLPRIHVGFIRCRAIVDTTTGVANASQAERNSKPGSRQPQLRSLVKSLSAQASAELGSSLKGRRVLHSAGTEGPARLSPGPLDLLTQKPLVAGFTARCHIPSPF